MSDGDKKPAAADAASASAAAVPADGEVLKKPGKEAQSAAADEDAKQKKEPQAEISPEMLAKLKKEAVKAQEAYEKASGEKAAADAKKLRVGSYVIDKGTQRPFVYVPKGFDVNARGAIGQVLEALGVKDALDQAAPSMVLRVSKATMPRLRETAAVRQTLSLADLEMRRK